MPITQDLIYAIASGKSQDIDDAFKAIVAEKITAAIDSKRQEVAANMFATVGESVDLEEHVNHDDINYALERHAYSHVNWGQHVDHAQRHAGIETDIKERHGEKALKHVKDHSEAHLVYAKAEQGSKKGITADEYKVHGAAINKHMVAAQDASIEHQKANAPRHMNSIRSMAQGVVNY